MKNKDDHTPVQGAVRNKAAEKIKWRTRCNDMNKGDGILLPGSTEIAEEGGKSKRRNIYTKDSPCSFVQPTCTDHHVTSVSSPLLSSQPNLPLPSHPLKCLFFVKASLDRSSHGDLSSLFTPPTNYNQGLSLTLNCSLIVFPPLSLSSQLHHRPPTGTTWHTMLLLPPTGSSTGISSTNIC